jgi:hypothetical protein
MEIAIAKIVTMEAISIRIMTVTITMFMVVATGTTQTGILRHQQIPLIQCTRPILVML